MIQGLDHIAIAVSNIPSSVDFYHRLLGFRIVDSRDMEAYPYFWLNFGVAQNLTLSLNPKITPKSLGLSFDYPRVPHMAFCASELEISHLRQKLQQEGVEVHGDDTEIYFTDPDGNGIEVTCWREMGLKNAGKPHW